MPDPAENLELNEHLPRLVGTAEDSGGPYVEFLLEKPGSGTRRRSSKYMEWPACEKIEPLSEFLPDMWQFGAIHVPNSRLESLVHSLRGHADKANRGELALEERSSAAVAEACRALADWISKRDPRGTGLQIFGI